jgi:hypothetical protein
VERYHTATTSHTIGTGGGVSSGGDQQQGHGSPGHSPTSHWGKARANGRHMPWEPGV